MLGPRDEGGPLFLRRGQRRGLLLPTSSSPPAPRRPVVDEAVLQHLHGKLQGYQVVVADVRRELAAVRHLLGKAAPSNTELTALAKAALAVLEERGLAHVELRAGQEWYTIV